MSEEKDWITTTRVLDRMLLSDDTAWMTFVDRFRDPIVGFACKSGLSESDAEDVAQSALLTFVEGLRDGRYERGKGQLRAWLFGIAGRKVQEKRRETTRGGRHMQRPMDTTGFWAQIPDADDDDPAKLWEVCWERGLMKHCLEQVRGEVDAKTFQAFVDVALQGKPVKDVAESLGMTPNAISIAKHRIIKRLQSLKERADDV